MARTHIALVGVLVSFFAVSSFAGCGGDGGGTATDGGAGPDSATGDAATGSDAGAPDSSAGDAGTGDDGGTGHDAGTGRDAGSDDAGLDGGPPVSMPCTPTGACDPFAAAPCPDGQSCRTGAMGLACYPVDAAPLAEGQTCTAAAQCAPGTMCLDFGGGFRCTLLCPDGSIGFCGDGRACTGTIGDVCVQACRPTPVPCDIYAQDCADPAQTCTLTRNPETDAPYTGCRPAGPRAEGEPCGGTDGTCGHDLVCIRTGDVTACRQPCDPDDPSEACPGGQACTGLSRTWMVGYCTPTP